jgi:hypothetical protein
MELTGNDYSNIVVYIYGTYVSLFFLCFHVLSNFIFTCESDIIYYLILLAFYFAQFTSVSESFDRKKWMKYNIFTLLYVAIVFCIKYFQTNTHGLSCEYSRIFVMLNMFISSCNLVLLFIQLIWRIY